MRCPKCSAPNPDGRTDCYNCGASLTPTMAMPGPPGTPAQPPASYYPPPSSATTARALGQWLGILGWVVLGLAACCAIYLAAEAGPSVVNGPSGWFFLELGTYVVVGLVGCVVLRAFGAMVTLLSEMRDTLRTIESNTRQTPNP